MKISQDTGFKPVTIILESPLEVAKVAQGINLGQVKGSTTAIVLWQELDRIKREHYEKTSNC